MLITSDEINGVLKSADRQKSDLGKKYFEQGKVEILDFNFALDDKYILKVRLQDGIKFKQQNKNIIILKKVNSKVDAVCTCQAQKGIKEPCEHIIATVFDLYINHEKYREFKVNSDNVKNEELEIVQSKKKLKIDTNIYEENKTKEISDNLDKLVNFYEYVGDNHEVVKKDLKSFQITPILEDIVMDDAISALKVSFKVSNVTDIANKEQKEQTKIECQIKDIYKFVEDVICKNTVKYKKGIEFKHVMENFDDKSAKICKLILKKINSKDAGVQSNKVVFDTPYIDDLFDVLEGNCIKSNILCSEKKENQGDLVRFKKEDIRFEFEISKLNKDNLSFQIKADDSSLDTQNNFHIFEGIENEYVLYKGDFCKCSSEYRLKIIPVLRNIKNQIIKDDVDNNLGIVIPSKKMPTFLEYVASEIKHKSDIVIPQEIKEKYKSKELAVKVFLDIDVNFNIVAQVKFCYEDLSFNPFKIDEKIPYSRNVRAEKKVKEVFKKFKFLLNPKNSSIYISKDEDIYEFLSSGIEEFMKKFEVHVTENLKNKGTIKKKIIGVNTNINNNLLEINFTDIGMTNTEIKDMLNRYKIKKKYYRLKDGTYIDIDSSGVSFLNNVKTKLGISEEDMSKGIIRLPKYKIVQFENMAQDYKEVSFKKSESVKMLLNDIKESKELNFKLDGSLEEVLRPYQKHGFNFLKMLEKYQFGGILADDMGLGKTLQIIAVLLDESKNDKRTSIIVCPSSLCINWKREITKFAPSLKVLIVSGLAKKRHEELEKIRDYDVVISSYDLVKRDIDKYKDYFFKYIVADEAQYIKNHNTKNAKAIKMINGGVRYALTGTPIENSLSEIWSIFDYIMPGYLPSYKKFRDKYEKNYKGEVNEDLDIKDINMEEENNVNLIELKKWLSPFILRRIKKDVLEELPDKTETVMYSKLETEQEKIYHTYMKQAKGEIEDYINKDGVEKSKMKILCAITRLRQICCHPSLFLEDYIGESSKLKQAIEIVKDATESGHKILIFSQFTTMFEYIKKELEELNIEYLTLTGKTKISERIDLVEKFNTTNIPVFLISLKAGGTGLNLTGADMVIHFDPWWNVAAQNQATDRAHRIGQRNNVQVFKLIAENTIEEKIQKLQEKKETLTDSIISSTNRSISSMTKTQIIELFED